MAYIATYAQHAGFNVGLLDAEAHGLGVTETARLINAVRPRWVGMNLLAPTYEMSARITALLDPGIALMVGGHHARAMPARVLDDPRMGNLRALVVGEGETRVAALLADERRRAELPGVLWRDRLLGTHAAGYRARRHRPLAEPGHRRPAAREPRLPAAGPVRRRRRPDRGEHRRLARVPVRLRVLRRRRLGQPRRDDPAPLTREHRRRARPSARDPRDDRVPVRRRPVPRRQARDRPADGGVHPAPDRRPVPGGTPRGGSTYSTASTTPCSTCSRRTGCARSPSASSRAATGCSPEWTSGSRRR
nr:MULTISPECIES: cobalamin B12-binding domain-containing protein [unclassified Streptomyces]